MTFTPIGGRAATTGNDPLIEAGTPLEYLDRAGRGQ